MEPAELYGPNHASWEPVLAPSKHSMIPFPNVPAATMGSARAPPLAGHRGRATMVHGGLHRGVTVCGGCFCFPVPARSTARCCPLHPHQPSTMCPSTAKPSPGCVFARGHTPPVVSPPHHGEVRRPWAAVGVRHNSQSASGALDYCNLGSPKTYPSIGKHLGVMSH